MFFLNSWEKIMSIKIGTVNHVVLTVTDLERAKEFYTTLLGLNYLMNVGPERIVVGNDDIVLAIGLPPDASQAIDNDKFSENRVGLDHVSFNVESRADLEAAIKLFDENNVSHGDINDLTPHGLPILVLAFRDPDNIQLELTAPAG
jgi:glyoxylase I family protein